MLWNTHETDLSEDFHQDHYATEAEHLAPHAIQQTLNFYGYDCVHLDLPDPEPLTIPSHNNDANNKAQEEEQGRQVRDNLNREQFYVL